MKKTLLLAMIANSLFAIDLPNIAYTKSMKITPESDYNVYKVIREGEKLLSKGQSKKASKLFIKALSTARRIKTQNSIDQYDFLLSKYALLNLLENSDDTEHYKKMARSILYFLDKTTNYGKDIWEESDLGKFQLELYRNILNKYAKILYKESKRKDKKLLKQSMQYIKKAERFIRSDDDFYIKETKRKISNALEGNPPLKDEKEVQIIKIIKNDANSTKKPLKK